MHEKKDGLDKKIDFAHCVCVDKTGLFVPNRQLSGIVAGSIVVLFAFFTIGFFWGQRSGISQFSQKLDQDSFGDQIYSSLCALHDQNEEATGDDDDSQTELAPDQQDDSDANDTSSTTPEVVAQSAITSQELANKQSTAPGERYYAQLAGFSDMRAAQRCAQRMKNRGVLVEIQTRTSKTARGRMINWYQVVTLPFNSKEELRAIIDRIAQQEKISDIRIKTC